MERRQVSHDASRLGRASLKGKSHIKEMKCLGGYIKQQVVCGVWAEDRASSCCKCTFTVK